MTGTVLPFPGTPAPPEALAQLLGPVRRPRRRPLPEQAPALARPPRALSTEEAALQLKIVEAYFNGRRRAQGHVASGIRRDRAVVDELLGYVGQPLWAITPEDFESWAVHLGVERKLAPSTQRTMQTAVATFFDYVVDHQGWQNEVHRCFQARTERIVTRANRLIHTTDDAPRLQRDYLTAAQLDGVFDVLDLIVEVAAAEAPRRLKAFQRDRAMFYAFYGYGLRLAEGQQLTVNSFHPNPDLPELGRFGLVTVAGKGARGSGPRMRTVNAILPDLGPLLAWYIEDVRPKFRVRSEDDTAMWLSERGRRLSRPAIAVRYKTLIRACGLDPERFSPHGLRHMHVSHQAQANVPTLFTSRSVGHSSPAVTARYTHAPDDYHRTIAFNFVSGVLRNLPEGA